MAKIYLSVTLDELTNNQLDDIEGKVLSTLVKAFPALEVEAEETDRDEDEDSD